MNRRATNTALAKVLRAVSCGVFALSLGVAGEALGFDLKPSEIRGESSKKPVSVLQNRYFLKSWRPEAGLMAGTILDEAYLDSNVVGVRGGLFINEWMGLELQSIRTMVEDSDDRKALRELKYRPLDEEESADATAPGVEEEVFVTPDPEVNAISGITDVNAVFAPFYGKLNIMNAMIVYTDLYLIGGYSAVETDQGVKNAMQIGGGERFYIGQSWSIRVDYRDRIFTETRAGRETTKHLQTIDVGAGYFFN